MGAHVINSCACLMSGPMLQVQQVGKQRLVLDLSCRKKDGRYYVVTDRWQRFSELIVNAETLSSLGEALMLPSCRATCHPYALSDTSLAYDAAALRLNAAASSRGCNVPRGGRLGQTAVH